MIVSIPDLCLLSYFGEVACRKLPNSLVANATILLETMQTRIKCLIQ